MIVLDLNDVDIRNLTFDSLMGYLKKIKTGMHLQSGRRQLSWVDEALGAAGRTWTAHRVSVEWISGLI